MLSRPRLLATLAALALTAAWLDSSPVRAVAQLAQVQAVQIPGQVLAPDAVAVVDFAALAAEDETRRRLLQAAGVRPVGVAPVEGRYEEPLLPAITPLARGPHDSVPQPRIPSPGPTLSYQGLDDISDGQFFYIPPDTMGAVGPTRIFNTLNNNYRIITKATGATVSTVAQNSFWHSVNPNDGVFDPQALYDPYSNRFIVAAVAGGESTTSSVLVGVSTSSDPGGTWTIARYPMGTTNCTGSQNCWADFPTLGFNQTWIAIGLNMFRVSNNAFIESRVTTFNYSTFLGGTAPAVTTFTTTDFTVRPVTTYSNSETTLYAPAHVSSAAASYRLNTITGTANSPVYTQGALKTHTLLGAWASPGGDILPQAPEPMTSLMQGIDAGDARILSAVFRNNAIWYAQTIGLPAGGLTHTAAQWVKLNTSGNDVDAGRLEDPTATSTNGGKWYAYPSVSVNASNDVLIGYSQFSSSQFPAAGYSFRASTDAAGTLRDPVIPRSGIGFYFKTFGGPSNRWGDFSSTQVDPSDDVSFWTVQEYSKAQVGTGDGSGFWSTWWAQVVPPVQTHTLTVNKTGSGTGTVTSTPAGIDCGATCSAQFTSGQVVTLSANPTVGSIFGGWSGDADCSDGSVTMTTAVTCTATFTQVFTLTVTKTGSGSGTVTSSPAGIDCGATCSAAFVSGQVVLLTATPAAGSIFSGWSGDADCSDGSVTMTSAITCTATFTQVFTLTVTKVGTGSGTVTSTPAGINCGVVCSAGFTSGQIVTLSASPMLGSIFTGWTGDADCSDGSVTMSAARSCIAVFHLPEDVRRRDFNRDGKPDLIWQHDTTRQATVWYMGGTDGNVLLGSDYLSSSTIPDWRIVGVADFNADGSPDLVWQHDTTRQATVWYMGGTNGNVLLGSNYLNSSTIPDWRIVAVADFNRDSHPDLVWQHDTTRQVTVWYLGGAQGNAFIGADWLSSSTIPDWRVVAAADFNADGHPDLVWQHDTTRQVTVWYMGGPQGNTFLGANWLSSGSVAGWTVVVVSDFNTDGHPDLIWQNDSTRQVTVWYMGSSDGSLFLGSNWLSTATIPDWRLVGR